MSESATASSPSFGMPTPGLEHHRLASFVGQFRATVKIWMGPGEPLVSTGTMVNTLVLDGLYLQQDYVGDATAGPFPSFAGKGFWGFNQVAQKYEGFWIDNASTIMQVETGSVDATGKVWDMHNTVQTSPGGAPEQRHSRITLADHDHHAIEMFFTAENGQEVKGMEIQYTRVK